MGQPEHLILPNIKKAYSFSGFVSPGLLHFPLSCNCHMGIAFLDSGASYNLIASPHLKQFALNAKDWWWAKPLQVKLTNQSTVYSSHIVTLL